MPLLKRADVLVEQFRPGVMARLGLGYDGAAQDQSAADLLLDHRLRPDRPARRRSRARHQLHRQHRAAGAAARARSTGPIVPPALIADIGGGTLPAVINILLALRQRDRTGQGCDHRHRHDGRDVHLRLACARGRATSPGSFPARASARLTGGSPRYQLYPTRDGKLVACGALEQKFWVAFTAAIGLARGVRRRPPRSGGDQGGGGGDHRGPQRGRMAAGARRRPIAASPSWRRWKRRCAIRISSAADCSRTRLPARRARPCRRCRCRSIRRSAARHEDRSRCPRSAPTTSSLQRLAAHQPRLRSGARRPRA